MKRTSSASSYSELQKYCRQPACLKCGYDLRVQLSKRHDHCPECGRPCRAEDLVDQIADQSWYTLPIIAELFIGLIILLALPIGLISVIVVLSSFIFSLGIESIKPTIVLCVLGIIVWLLGLLGSIKTACEMFGSFKGALLWCLMQVLLLLYLISVLMVGIWCLWLLVVFINLVFQDANFRNIASANWAFVFLLLGVSTFIVCKSLISRLVIEPSRKRCRELAMQWLTEYQMSHDSQEHPHAPNS